jgi:hypothetical protein
MIYSNMFRLLKAIFKLNIKECVIYMLWEHIRNTWKVLKCGAGEGWRRSVGPIM